MYRNSYCPHNTNMTNMANMTNMTNVANNSCSSLSDKAIAMAYVPWQMFQSVYDLETALMVGTIFPELNKPFRSYTGGMKCSK